MKTTHLSILFLLFSQVSCNFFPSQNFKPESSLYTKANPIINQSIVDLATQSQIHEVLVAIIDSGVDYNHKALKKNIRLNKTTPTGIGFDVLGLDNWPYPILINPENGKEYDDIIGINDHGTHVAGLATLGGYVKNYKDEKRSVNELIGLIPIRALPLSNEGIPDAPQTEDPLDPKLLAHNELIEILATDKIVSTLESAIEFAHQEGAHIINLSLGVDGTKMNPKAAERLKDLMNSVLIKKMKSDWSNILFVSAAGNDAAEVSETNYPASIKESNTLTIGALSKYDLIAEYSDYGHRVDVYINGSNINSIVPENLREKLDGTSMASPIAANLAAKILIVSPCLKAQEIRSLIIQSAIPKTVKVENSEKTRDILVLSFKNALELAKKYGNSNCKLDRIQ